MLVKELFSEQEIQDKIKTLAQVIYNDYAQINEDFLILYPEKGARIFAQSLQTEFIKLDAETGRYKGIISIIASRTMGMSFLDNVKLENFQPDNLKGKNVLLVEDIIDQGITLDAILEQLKGVVNTCRVCVLVDKTEDRRRVIKLDYVGFQVSQGWVVGMGMDVEQEGRNLPFIGIIEGK